MSQILIIGDDSESRHRLQALLTAEGYEVAAASHSTEALDAARWTLPDLIILDSPLPALAEDAIGRLLQVDERSRDIPILVTTDASDVQGRSAAFRVGAADIISRPFEADEISARVRTCVTMSRLRKELAAHQAQLRQTMDHHEQTEETLRLSDEKYRALVENISDVIFSVDAQGGITYISPVVSRMTMYEPGEIVGQPFHRFIHPDDLPGVQASFERTLSGQLEPYEFRIFAKDGAVLHVSTSSRPLWEGGHLVGLTGVMTNITDRKQAEVALRVSEAHYRELSAQTETALIEIQALYHVAQSLIASDDLSALLQTVADSVSVALPADRVTLIIVNLPERQVTQFVQGGPGQTETRMVAFDELWDGLTGWVLREMQPALSSKEGLDPRESAAVQRRRQDTNSGSIIVVPLSYQGKAMGTLTAINRPAQREFTQRDVDLMVAMASQVTTAIENARLYQELQATYAALERRVVERTTDLARANRMLKMLSDCNQALIRATDETTLLDSVCDLIVWQGGYTLAWVGLAEMDAARTVRPVAHKGFDDGYLNSITITWDDAPSGQGPTGTAIRTARPCIVTHIQTDPHFVAMREEATRRGYASSVTLPLLSGDRAFGALNIFAAEPDAFAPQEVDLLTELAGDLAYGIMALRTRSERERAEAALAEQHRLLRTLIDHMPDAIYVKDGDSRFVVANEATAQVMGTTLDRLLGTTDFDYYPSELAAEYFADEQSVIQSGEALINKEEPYIDPAGKPRWMSTTKVPLRENDGRIKGIVGIGRDITSGKEMEQALRRAHNELEQRVEQRTAELSRANARLAALYQVAQTITAPLQVVAVLDAVVGSAVNLLNSDTGAILLLDETGEFLTIQGAYGLSDAVVQGTHDRVGASLAGRVVQTGQPIVANDLPHDPRFDNPSAVGEGLLACLSVPLMVSGKIIGTLDVHSKTDPYAFNEDHIQLLNMLASQAAIVIDNTRLYEQLKLAHDELEMRVQQRTAELLDSNAQLQQEITERKRAEEVLQQRQNELESLLITSRDLSSTLDSHELLALIARRATSLLLADGCTIFRLEEEQGTLHPILSVGEHAEEKMAMVLTVGQGLTGYSIAQRQPVLANNAQNDGRALAVPGTPDPEAEHIMVCPLVFRDHITGAMLVNRLAPQPFTDDNFALFIGFAGQVAVAIENARLFQSEHDQRTLAEALRDSAEAVNSTLNFDEVLDRILDNVGRVLPHRAANIMLLENDTVHVARARGYAAYRMAEVIQNLRFVLADRPKIQEVFARGRPVVLADVQHDPRWGNDPEAFWVRSHASAPIQIDGQTIGLICVDSDRPGSFKRADAERLQTFANQAALAIKNARLFTAERDQRTLAEALRDTAAALNTTLNFDEVLDRILTNAGRVALHDGANIEIIEEPGVARVIAVRGYEKWGVGVEELLSLRFPLQETHNLRMMIETRKPLVVADTYREDRWYHTPQTHWIRSYVGAPILVEGKVIGFINLDSATPDFFTPLHASQLQAFTDQAAVAIQNARLYQKLEAYSENLEATVEARTAELRYFTQRVETILNSSSDAILLVGIDGAIRQVNPATCDMFGYENAEMFGQLPSVLFLPPHVEAYDSMFRYVISQGQANRLEITARRQNGTTFDADVALAPVREGEVITGIVCSVRDISALKEIERLKDAFVSNVSHELRTPITNLKLYQHLLAAQPQKLDVHLEVIQRETDRLSRIINDLLTLSRLDQGRTALNLSPVDLNLLARQYVDDRTLLAEMRGLKLTLIEQPDLSAIQADEGLLGQALSIMLTNALNYTPSGGQVTVRVRIDQFGGRSWAGISVSDTGPGIPPNEQPHLFERFFRGTAGRESGAPGTGLGLAILQEIVMRHQGRVDVVSDGVPGQGTAFTAWLPIESSGRR